MRIARAREGVAWRPLWGRRPGELGRPPRSGWLCRGALEEFAALGDGGGVGLLDRADLDRGLAEVRGQVVEAKVEAPVFIRVRGADPRPEALLLLAPLDHAEDRHL